ncbi:uncharacterized protein ACNFOS_007922 [Eudromia elegans]
MGRLDDHAKKRIVELRKAGLSFRKIKKVLELDNIRVTPQAVYLFLKRKNVEPSRTAAAQHATAPSPMAWQAQQLWPGLEGSEAEQEVAAAMGSERPCPCKSPASEEGIKIVSVTSLCKDGGCLGKLAPSGAPSGSQAVPGNSDDGAVSRSSALGSCAALLPPAVPQQALPSRGRLLGAPARNPALIVKKKIVDRAILLQKKVNIQNGQGLSSSTTILPFLVGVQPGSQSLQGSPAVLGTAGSHSTDVKDASTQTVLLNLAGAGNQNVAWGGPTLPPAPSSHAIAEKLDAVHTEIQKLSQAVHAVLERQCRLERQQEQQQRLQQEALVTLQQLSCTVSHSTVPGEQPCMPFGGVAEPSPSVPNFSQFKMELI